MTDKDKQILKSIANKCSKDEKDFLIDLFIKLKKSDRRDIEKEYEFALEIFS